MGLHPNHIDPQPKRRRDQKNPYHIFTVGIQTDDPHFYLSFIDSQGVPICMEISRELYELLDKFELEDLSMMNEFDNHWEHEELTEASLERRAVRQQESLEETIIRLERYDRLYKAIATLPEAQRRRLRLYYFGGLTYDEIAKLDGCTHQAVVKSVMAAKENLHRILMED